jgi:HEAT repeat protein
MTELLALLEDRSRFDLLAEAAAAESDDLLRLRQVTILAEVGDGRGLLAALDMLQDDTPPLLRDEAHELLLRLSGKDFGYDPFASGIDNEAALRDWRSWLE